VIVVVAVERPDALIVPRKSAASAISGSTTRLKEFSLRPTEGAA